MRVSFDFSRGGLIVTRVFLRHADRPVWARMAFDTGARLTVITPKVARELGLDPGEAEETAEVRGLRVACHPLSPKPGLDGILGLNFPDRFNIEINNEAERVVLTRWRE